LLKIFKTSGVSIIHNSPWISWNPNFWETEDADASCSCFFDQIKGLVDRALEVEPHWLGLDNAYTDHGEIVGARLA
jgi:hypothetical protein